MRRSPGGGASYNPLASSEDGGSSAPKLLNSSAPKLRNFAGASRERFERRYTVEPSATSGAGAAAGAGTGAVVWRGQGAGTSCLRYWPRGGWQSVQCAKRAVEVGAGAVGRRGFTCSQAIRTCCIEGRASGAS